MDDDEREDYLSMAADLQIERSMNKSLRAEIAALRETMRDAPCRDPGCRRGIHYIGNTGHLDCSSCGGAGTLEAYHDIKHGSVKK